ncbi:PilZ domain-containing protein [Devosia sp.]|uniref:PilZ domain-containing protein n=1 Tax=Devosia sp. TaxID=1871048 RepID=UPI003265C409
MPDADVALNSTQSAYNWHDVRFIGAVAGRYAFSDRPSGSDGKLPVYACRLCSISTRLVVLVGPVDGKRGEKITAHFEEFGIIRGTIARRLDGGFAVDIDMDQAARDKLGAKIVWQKRRVHDQVADKREHKRIAPRDPRTQIVLADGQRLPCFVIDISSSGAAVSAESWPEIGTPMALGRLVGRVVRYLSVGFAIQFIELQPFEHLEALMTSPESAVKAELD